MKHATHAVLYLIYKTSEKGVEKMKAETDDFAIAGYRMKRIAESLT